MLKQVLHFAVAPPTSRNLGIPLSFEQTNRRLSPPRGLLTPPPLPHPDRPPPPILLPLPPPTATASRVAADGSCRPAPCRHHRKAHMPPALHMDLADLLQTTSSRCHRRSRRCPPLCTPSDGGASGRDAVRQKEGTMPHGRRPADPATFSSPIAKRGGGAADSRATT
jgi:hypothetical protein